MSIDYKLIKDAKDSIESLNNIVMQLKNSTEANNKMQIDGLDKQIQELVEAIVLPVTNKEWFIKLGISPAKRLLLFGPPGTGKTTLALAIAGQNPDIPFYKLNAPEIVSGLSG